MKSVKLKPSMWQKDAPGEVGRGQTTTHLLGILRILDPILRAMRNHRDLS